MQNPVIAAHNGAYPTVREAQVPLQNSRTAHRAQKGNPPRSKEKREEKITKEVRKEENIREEEESGFREYKL